jgi:GNAT superfamily N-acetyltransferase
MAFGVSLGIELGDRIWVSSEIEASTLRYDPVDIIIDLLSLVVDQAYRGRGAGRMLIRFGTDKADELGIETVVSSLPSAKGAYEKCGLGAIEIIPADVDVPDPSPRWQELQDDDLSGWLMWRPIGHDYMEGIDKAPWLH